MLSHQPSRHDENFSRITLLHKSVQFLPPDVPDGGNGWSNNFQPAQRQVQNHTAFSHLVFSIGLSFPYAFLPLSQLWHSLIKYYRIPAPSSR